MVKYRAVDSKWDHNGTFTVRVAAPWPRTKATDAGVRRAARGIDPMGLVKRTHITDVIYVPGHGLRFTVRATRLDS